MLERAPVSNHGRKTPKSSVNLLPEGRVEGDGSGRNCCAVSKLRLGNVARFRYHILKKLRCSKSTSSVRETGRDMAAGEINRRSEKHTIRATRGVAGAGQMEMEATEARAQARNATENFVERQVQVAETSLRAPTATPTDQPTGPGVTAPPTEGYVPLTGVAAPCCSTQAPAGVSHLQTNQSREMRPHCRVKPTDTDISS
jgi:hypothetical protein